ncbi:MAG: MmcB family DNA repair protein [Paracoccaceae bacterium]
MPDDLRPPPGPDPAPLKPGQLLARGVSRHLRAHDFASVEEFVPASGLRVDVMAIGPKGEVWIVECKSSRADFRADAKWQSYLQFCDRYFWAVDEAFPTEILPDGTGLMIADAYDAALLRLGPEAKLTAARRRAMTLRFARHCAMRHQSLRDPGFVLSAFG